MTDRSDVLIATRNYYLSGPSPEEIARDSVKYIWRADLKADAIEDLKKAVWYIQRELAKRGSP